MARATRTHAAGRVVGCLLLAAIVAVAAWVFLGRGSRGLSTAPSMDVSAARIDPANEGRSVSVAGALRVVQPARDAQLGVAADALVLLRDVQMLQWRENCAASACTYALEWSVRPIDSSAFKIAAGHRNPARLPFSSERFAAPDVRLGAFKVDAAFAAGAAEPVALPVHAAQLPPNLAATFRERDGVLYAGADNANAAAGDVRVSYRIVAVGERRLSGIQHGDRLVAPAH